MKCQICGHPLVRNPHPDAGRPKELNRVGALYGCLPCANARANSRLKLIGDFRRWLENEVAEFENAAENSNGEVSRQWYDEAETARIILRKFDGFEEARKKSIRG